MSSFLLTLPLKTLICYDLKSLQKYLNSFMEFLCQSNFFHHQLQHKLGIILRLGLMQLLHNQNVFPLELIFF